MRLRSFQPADEVEVIALWEACGLLAPHNDPRKDIARKLRVNPELFIVGESSGKIIGTCMVGYEGHRGGSTTLPFTQIINDADTQRN